MESAAPQGTDGLRLYARELLERGRSRRDVVKALAASGLKEFEAETLVASIRFRDSSAGVSLLRRRGREAAVATLLGGCASVFFGLIASLFRTAISIDRIYVSLAIVLGAGAIVAGVAGILIN